MNRFVSIILTVVVFASSASAVEPTSAKSRKPNILVILADDLGYADLGCQGCKDVPTPNIDRLAREGIRFTSGYVTAPLCSPSRAGLLTGRSGNRYGFETNIGGAKSGKGVGLPVTEITLAERLKALGYRTALIGKWHLGYESKLLPRQRGFDRHYGYLGATHSYRIRKQDFGDSLRDLPDEKMPTYSTEALAAETAAFIEKNRGEPWFALLSFTAVHASPDGGKKLVPMDAGGSQQRFATIESNQRRIFAGMLSALDDGVGVVLAKLRELNLEEDTIIVFLSDNGGPTWQTTSRNFPLSGFKGDLLEGGVRVPFIVQWKGHLPSGKTYDHPVSSLDVVPTTLAAVGAPAEPNLDGVDLVPYLTGKKEGRPHAMLAWRYFEQRAVRMGDWKLVDVGNGWKLHNLATDIAEKNDLSKQEPAKLTELEAAYAQWNAKNIPAKWKAQGVPIAP